MVRNSRRLLRFGISGAKTLRRPEASYTSFKGPIIDNIDITILLRSRYHKFIKCCRKKRDRVFMCFCDSQKFEIIMAQNVPVMLSVALL